MVLLIMLALVSMVVHAVLFFLPGDPAQIMLGLNATPETVAHLKAELGLDRPFLVQYWDWIWGLMRLKTGRSLNYDIPVMELISSRFAVTGPVAVLAMFFAVIIAIPLGVFAARRHNRTGDVAVMAFTQAGLATPEFWLGYCSSFFSRSGCIGSRLAGSRAGARISGAPSRPCCCRHSPWP